MIMKAPNQYFLRFIDRHVRQLRQWERSQSANLPPFHKVNIQLIFHISMLQSRKKKLYLSTFQFIFHKVNIKIFYDWVIISQGPQINLQGGVGYHWEPDSWKELGGQEESREKSQKHCGEFDMWTQNDEDVSQAAFFFQI